MLSFHNDPAIKEKYLSRVIKHRELDNIIQGIGWENGKGCAVGCTLESYDHLRYPIELGIPMWMAYLEDRIFENLPKEISMTWPERFLSSVPVGVDLEPIKHKLDIRRLKRLIKLQEKNELDLELKNKVIDSINLVISFHEDALENINNIDLLAAESAASAAWSAWSAERSAASASWSAWSAERSAASAARSAAWSAASTAESTAESAASAAWSTEESAWSAAFIKESEDLLELLREAK